MIQEYTEQDKRDRVDRMKQYQKYFRGTRHEPSDSWIASVIAGELKEDPKKFGFKLGGCQGNAEFLKERGWDEAAAKWEAEKAAKLGKQ